MARQQFIWHLLFTLSLTISAALPAQENAKPGTAGQEDSNAITAEKTKADLERDVTQGALRVVKKDGSVVECPLKHTDVRADIAGFVGRVQVTQTFANPSAEPIEAVYVFPLPHEAAVDAMTMTIGPRRIVGVIKKRNEAREIYQRALLAGQTAALLEQERPNIFTQSVGNIEPGQEVKIEISYVDVLRYDLGTYEFQFPMVVGPRYIPGSATSTPAETPKELRGRVSPPVANTDRVPDAEKISPPVLRPGVRNGHDVSLSVSLDSGVPIQDLVVANHQATVSRDGDHKAQIKLSAKDSVPNKDFVLRYRVSGKQPAMALLAHTGKYSGDAQRVGNGYFMLMIQPQEDERLHKSPPREIVFLVDVSGSMSGQPTAKVRETMQHMLRWCREQDTVQVITFASQSHQLFEKAVPATQDNVAKALNFTAGLQGSGGTEMLTGVKLAIDAPLDEKRVRIVVMLTDGYIGNEAEIIQHVGKHCGDQVRFWCVGIGQAPNMFLVDGVAKQGGGMGKQLGLNDDSAALSQEIVQRIQRAQLAQVRIDWGNSRVSETFPAKVPELWAGRPIIVFGRFAGGGQRTTIKVDGKIEGEPASWPLEVTFPAAEPKNDVLAKVWSRRKIEDLMQQAYYFDSPAIEEEVTAIALDYRLMSQYTSFVAVDEKEAKEPGNDGGRASPPRRMLVPVPLPEGTRWQGFFGGESDVDHDLDGLADQLSLFGDSRALGLEKAPADPQLRVAGGTMRFARRDKSLAPGRHSMGGAMPGGGAGALGGAGYGLSQLSLSAAKPVSPSPVALYEATAVKEEGFYRRLSYADGEEATAASIPLMQSQVKSQLEAARIALTQGREAQDKGPFSEAANFFARAYLLAKSVENAGGTDEGVSTRALEALEAVRKEQVDAWSRELPSLQKPLDLVVRDKSISEALELIAKSAAIKIELVPGSAEDSATLLGRPARVNYLDLRGATLAQACDWLLLPLRMTWQLSPQGKALIAGTCRRLPGQSPWIYDVSLIAWPTKDELAAEADTQKRVDNATQTAKKLVQVVQTLGRTAKVPHVSWFTPAELLVVATADQHAELDRLLAALTKTDSKLGKEAAELRAVTSKRAQQRMPEKKKQDQATTLANMKAELQRTGWKLLSSARLGSVDQGSLTELQIAWSSPEVAALIAEGRESLALLRSAWVVNEAASLLPQDRALQAIATQVRLKTQSVAAKAIAAVQDSTQANMQSIVQSAYAALLYRQDEKLLKECVQAMQGHVKSPELGAIASLVLAILQPKSTESESTLIKIAGSGVQGPDLVVLLHWACQQAGRKASTGFRENSPEWLSAQPLPEEVVVLVNR